MSVPYSLTESRPWPFSSSTIQTDAITDAMVRLAELGKQRIDLQRAYDAACTMPGYSDLPHAERARALIADLDADYSIAQDELWVSFLDADEFFLPGQIGVRGGEIEKRWRRRPLI